MSTARSSITVLRRMHTLLQLHHQVKYLSNGTIGAKRRCCYASVSSPTEWMISKRFSPPTTPSSPSSHTSLFERTEQQHRTLKRYFGSVDSQKLKNLYQECSQFLQRDNLPESTSAGFHIVRLINDLSKIWDSHDFDDSIVSMKAKSIVGEQNVSGKEINLLRKVVDVVDKLAHILLQIKQANMDNQKDRTRYGATLSLALSFWTKCPPGKDNGIRANKILERMEELDIFTEMEDSAMIRQISYGAVIQAYCITIDDPQDGTVNGAIEARKLLERLESIQGYDPPLRVYNSCLHGFAIRGMIDEAEGLLSMLEERSKTNNQLVPDVLTYSACLNAYSKYTGKEVGKPLAERAEDILRRMIKRYDSTGNLQFRPNQYTFGTVIGMFAKRNTANAAKDADRILQMLISLAEKEAKTNVSTYEEDAEDSEKYSIQPGVGHFVSVLLAYKNQTSAAGVKRIEELLVQMEQLFIAGNDQVKPNYQCFVIYLDALAKANNPEKAEMVLSRIEELCSEDKSFDLNNYGYNLVIDAWARSSKSGRAKRAEAIIKRMNDISSETGNKSLLPDKHTYTCLMNVLITDREQGFEDKCAEILSMMEAGDERIKPDNVTYSSMIKAYAYANKPEQAEVLLRTMEKQGVSPPQFCYNGVINAYGKNNNPGSARKAILILEQMEKNGVNPDIMSYAICIDALGRSDEANRVQRAEEMFSRCIQRSTESHQKSNKVSLPIFSALQSVYIRSDDHEKVQKTLKVIKVMEENGIKPTLTSYKHVLSACSRVPRHASEQIKQKAVEIAARILEFLRNSNDLNPDSQTYNSLLWVCSLVSDPKEKYETINAVFKMCCQDGFLSRQCLGSLKQVAGNEQFYELVGHKQGHVDVTVLDPSWSRNADNIQNFSPSRRRQK
mmetsp:Transcript_12102/g.22648  ORF Transcript_12102/g.22648 Transcript_12102/m.22648 type:complete len:897 (+) Transcript_12102:266-2956(+)